MGLCPVSGSAEAPFLPSLALGGHSGSVSGPFGTPAVRSSFHGFLGMVVVRSLREDV